MARYKLSPVTNNYTFETFDKVAHLTDKIGQLTNFTRNEEELTKPSLAINLETKLPIEYMQIRKMYKFMGKEQILRAYENGDIIPMYLKTVTLTDSIPTVLTINNGKPVALANVSNHLIVNKNMEFKMNPKKLYLFLNSAYIHRGLYLKKDKLIDNDLIYNTCLCYTLLLIRILNKKYNINISQILYNEVFYLIFKFAAIKLFELENTETNNNLILRMGSKKIKSISIEYLEEVERFFDYEDFISIDKFITKLTEKYSIFSNSKNKLTVRGLFDEYFRYYGASMQFSLEYLPCLYHNLSSAYIGAEVNKGALIVNALGELLKDTLVQVFRFINS